MTPPLHAGAWSARETPCRARAPGGSGRGFWDVGRGVCRRRGCFPEVPRRACAIALEPGETLAWVGALGVVRGPPDRELDQDRDQVQPTLGERVQVPAPIPWVLLLRHDPVPLQPL